MLNASASKSARALTARRVFAAVAACWIVCCGVLSMRHEAAIAHVRDPQTGELRHATGLVGQHTTDQSDIHGAPAQHSDDDACGIAAAFHQAGRAETPAPMPCAPPATERIAAELRAGVTRPFAVYRLAPKTSPPASI